MARSAIKNLVKIFCKTVENKILECEQCVSISFPPIRGRGRFLFRIQVFDLYSRQGNRVRIVDIFSTYRLVNYKSILRNRFGALCHSRKSENCGGQRFQIGKKYFFGNHCPLSGTAAHEETVKSFGRILFIVVCV